VPEADTHCDPPHTSPHRVVIPLGFSHRLVQVMDRELVISETVALRAGIDFGAAPRREIEIRGRDERLVVRTFTNALDLPAIRDVSLGQPRRFRAAGIGPLYPR
jgi:hypothetical protein